MADDEDENEKREVVTLSPETRQQILVMARSLQESQAIVARSFQPGISNYLASMETFRETMRRIDVAGTLREYQRSHEAIVEALRNASPALEQFRELQRSIAANMEPWRQFLANQRAWQESLSERLALLPTSVVLTDPARTIEGFARLSRIRDATRDAEPFSRPVTELLQEEFGDVAEAVEKADDPEARDAAAIDAGLNPDLIAFEPSAYPNVLVCAGFTFELPPLPLPLPIEGTAEGASFDSNAWLLLKYLENALRVIIERELQEIAGNKWVKQRVPLALREVWQKRQQEARDENREVYPLIYYADFGDMRILIQQRNNWDDVFGPIFAVKEDVMESLRRLPSIRNSDAHSRPLSRVDMLFLTSEATRLIAALRRAGLLQ